MKTARCTTLLSLFIIPLTLFIVLLGMRVPDVSRPHSPRLHPRAVVEISAKALQEAGVEASIPVMAGHPSFAVTVPLQSDRAYSHRESSPTESVPAEHLYARAPPGNSA
jgi:hypothetical protein